MAALNDDMLFERSRVLSQGSPQSAYVFNLCSGQVFDATTPIFPVLDNIFISCGEFSRVADNCVLSGGTTQIEVESFVDSSFPVTSIIVAGITFVEFSYAAVAGRNNANDITTLTLRDSFFTVSHYQYRSSGILVCVFESLTTHHLCRQ